jgi:uncharacterized lipoprotein YmbA
MEHNADASASNRILLRPPVLPGYLDAYPVVVGREGNTLVVSGKTEWAEPLREGVARDLRDALSQRLGASRVLIAGDGNIPDADLNVEFVALDPQQRVLRLDAKWSFSCIARDRESSAGRTVLEVPLESATAPAVASATADALGRLADVLATHAQCSSGALARKDGMEESRASPSSPSCRRECLSTDPAAMTVK